MVKFAAANPMLQHGGNNIGNHQPMFQHGDYNHI